MANTGKRKSSPSKKRQKQVKISPPQTRDVLAFWEQQAKDHGASDLATNPDQHYRKLEIERVLHVIGTMKHDTILDVGCGNGFATRKIAEAFPEAEIVGVDFSPNMIDQANIITSIGARALDIEFFQGDVLSLSRHKDLGGTKYDVVLSTRCLINLSNFDEQKIGILEMRKMLTPDGRLILVENLKEGLDNLNAVRAKFGLDPIQQRWHNHYIPEPELRKFIASMQGHMMTQEYVENIGCMYYIASRVIYAKMCKDQGIEPDYNNPINQIASQLPTFGEFYACSPNFMVILKNEGGGNANKAGKGFS